MLFLAAAFFLCPLNRLEIADHFAWSDASFLGAGVLLVVSFPLSGRSLNIPAFLALTVALFVLGGLVGFALHQAPGYLANCAKILVAMVMVPVAIASITDGRMETIERLMMFWIAGALLSGVVAILQHFGIYLFDLSTENASGGRVAGLAYHSNSLAFNSALTFFAALYFALASSTPYRRMTALVVACLLLDALILSGSRAGLVAVFVGAALLTLFTIGRAGAGRSFRDRWFAVLAAAAVLLVVVISSARFEGSTAWHRLFGQSSSAEGANDARRDSIKAAWRAIEASPFVGTGLMDLRSVHDHVIQTLYTTGLVGVLGFSCWLVGMCRCWGRVRRCQAISRAAERERMLLVLVGVMMVAWFVTGAFQPLLIDRNGYIPFGLMLALRIRYAFGRRIVSRPVSVAPTADALATHAVG